MTKQQCQTAESSASSGGRQENGFPITDFGNDKKAKAFLFSSARREWKDKRNDR